MRLRTVLITASLAALMTVALASCQKNEEEAQKFPRADDEDFQRQFSEMVSYRMPNGISVYLQQDSTYDQVAIELFYRAGFAQEPKGEPQVSHLAEHSVVFSPTANYKAHEAADFIGTSGRIAAEAVGDFVHFDYVVQQEKFEALIKITADQLRSLRFDPDVLDEQAKRAAKEITSTLGSDRASLTKFALITMLQAAQHGETFVPIYQANFDLTTDDLARFHKAHYRPNDMVIVIVGNVDVETARRVVDQNFSDIPAAPEAPKYEATLAGDRSVRWDIDGTVLYFVYPGPFEDERERAALVAFGSYLHQYLMRDPDLTNIARSTYTTNPTYPLTNLPFFVFAQPEQYRSVAEVREHLTRLVDDAIASVDEIMFERIIGVLESFVQASFLQSAANNFSVENHIVIGQHAVNTGVRHYLLNGLSKEEYVAMLETITYDEMKQILERYLSPDKRRVVTISR